jgi:hypothetical protein
MPTRHCVLGMAQVFESPKSTDGFLQFGFSLHLNGS